MIFFQVWRAIIVCITTRFPNAYKHQKIGSPMVQLYNGSSLIQRRIIWTNFELIKPIIANKFQWNFKHDPSVFAQKMHLKMSFAKWQQVWHGLIVSKYRYRTITYHSTRAKNIHCYQLYAGYLIPALLNYRLLYIAWFKLINSKGLHPYWIQLFIICNSVSSPEFILRLQSTFDVYIHLPINSI